MLPVLIIAAEGEARVPTASSRIADQLDCKTRSQDVLPNIIQLNVA